MCSRYRFLSFDIPVVILCFATDCITMVRCVAYIRDLIMTLTFGINIRMIFLPWLWIWQDHLCPLNQAYQLLAYGCITLRQHVVDILDLCMTMIFDLYGWRGVSFVCFTQFLSCSKYYGISTALHKYVYWLEMFLRWGMWPTGLLFSKFHQILMQFVRYVFLFQIPSRTPYLQSISALTSNQTRNPIWTSLFVFTPYLHSVFQSRPPHWTMWTPDHRTEKSEFLITTLTYVNYIPRHLTLWIINNPSELHFNTLNNVMYYVYMWTPETHSMWLNVYNVRWGKSSSTR